MSIFMKIQKYNKIYYVKSELRLFIQIGVVLNMVIKISQSKLFLLKKFLIMAKQNISFSFYKKIFKRLFDPTPIPNLWTPSTKKK